MARTSSASCCMTYDRLFSLRKRKRNNETLATDDNNHNHNDYNNNNNSNNCSNSSGPWRLLTRETGHQTHPIRKIFVPMVGACALTENQELTQVCLSASGVFLFNIEPAGGIYTPSHTLGDTHTHPYTHGKHNVGGFEAPAVATTTTGRSPCKTLTPDVNPPLATADPCGYHQCENPLGFFFVVHKETQIPPFT